MRAGHANFYYDLHFPPPSNNVFSEEEINFATSGVLERHKHAATNELGRAGMPKRKPHTMPQNTTVIIINVLP